jgi:GTP cyclohydrolase FolE2
VAQLRLPSASTCTPVITWSHALSTVAKHRLLRLFKIARLYVGVLTCGLAPLRQLSFFRVRRQRAYFCEQQQMTQLHAHAWYKVRMREWLLFARMEGMGVQAGLKFASVCPCSCSSSSKTQFQSQTSAGSISVTWDAPRGMQEVHTTQLVPAPSQESGHKQHCLGMYPHAAATNHIARHHQYHISVQAC